MSGNLILQIAREWGQSPGDVENWDEYWINRAATLLRAESIEQENRLKK